MGRYRCPKCKEVQDYDADQAGQIIACPECGTKVRLPAKPATAKAEPSTKDSEDAEDEERVTRRPAPKRKAVEDETAAPEEDEDDLEEARPRRKKKKRRRSIARQPRQSSGGVGIQGGWLDGIFAGPNLIWILLAAFFFGGFVFPVAVFAAITAADSDARRNAILAIIVSLVPGFGCCCMCGVGNPSNSGP
jgi:DNA-directed RNA polymerase subunit RPC12/RpoP